MKLCERLQYNKGECMEYFIVYHYVLLNLPSTFILIFVQQRVSVQLTGGGVNALLSPGFLNAMWDFTYYVMLRKLVQIRH